MDLALPTLALAPESVWGLVPRLMGVIYVVAFASLSRQVLGLIGSRGIAPVAQQLAAARANLSAPACYLEMPTLFWLNRSDAFVRALPLLGIAAGLVAIYGGPLGVYALLFCWVAHLSLDPCALMYPWDTLLFEAGFLALFLPGVKSLPELEAVMLPLPAVAFMWRLLIVRLMWGFAKFKFIGTKKGDSLYLRGFLAWMPMCNLLGWRMQHAPNWLLRASYAFMWLTEVVCPGLCLFTGLPRAIGGIGLMTLMGGIWATGNWGFFNLAYGLLCIVMLDTRSSLFDTTFADVISPAGMAVHAVMAVLALGAFLYFWANSWASQTFIHWPFEDITYKRRWLEWLIGFYRTLSPLRLIGAYGVFPPNSSPPIKIIPVFEGSRDGVGWQAYGYRFMPSTATSRPPIVAPHHPRIDHTIIYAGGGMCDGDYFASGMGAGRPYSFSPFSHFTWLHRAAQRLLEGESSVLELLGHNPFVGEPPRFVRVSLRALTPTSSASQRATGHFWHMRHIGLAFEAMEKDPLVWKNWLSPPELFHPDFVARRRNSPALKAMVEAYASGMPHGEAVRVESDLSAVEVQRFWDQGVPMIAASRGDFVSTRRVADQLVAHFGREAVLRFERIVERYAYLLRTRLEPHMWGDAMPRIEKRSNFRFHTLFHEIILDGREAFERMLSEPGLAAERAQRQTRESELHLIAVLRPEIIDYHKRTLRITQRVTTVLDRPLPGFLEFSDLLAGSAPEGEAWLPVCERSDDGEWSIANFGISTEPGGRLAVKPVRAVEAPSRTDSP